MPAELDDGFVGIAQTDWHHGRPVYDSTKLEGIDIPETPEGFKEPIFFTPGFSVEENEDVIVFNPKEGLNKAIVGVTNQNQAVYEFEELLHAMMEAEGWDADTAGDWISYNTLRDYSYRNQGPVVYENLDYILNDEE